MADSKDTKKPDSKAGEAADSDGLVVTDSTQDDLTSPGTEKEGTDVGNGMPNDEDLGRAMADAEQEAATPIPQTSAAKPKRKWSRKKIILISVAAVMAVIALLMIIPATRYGILGVFVKRDVTVTLLDAKTDKPVSNAAVSLADKSATTDAKGVATLKSVPVGSKKVKVTKKYYKDLSADVTVPLTGQNPSLSLDIEATGRQVPIKVINKISKLPVEGAHIAVDGTSSKTDKNGEAVVVLPADKSTMDATLSLSGYNNLSAKVTITEQVDDKNTFSLVPAGKLYFLSKRSGTIDVLKSNMDGSSVETVLKGTGKEEQYTTALLASRDWKYLALIARRDNDREKLYLIETATNKLSVIDEGDKVGFVPVGWSNNYFVFRVSRHNLNNWDAKRSALKSYNADTKSLKILDETAATGSDQNNYAYETMRDVGVLGGELVYLKDWSRGYYVSYTDQKNTFNTIRPDGSNKKVIKDFAAASGSFDGLKLGKPTEVYVGKYDVDAQESKYWRYSNGALIESKDYKDDFEKTHPTYLISPSGKSAFWGEPRDGKNTLFIGNADGSNAKQVAALSEFVPYGWVSDDYVLVSKKGSELYVMARSNIDAPLKATDYHKPGLNYYFGHGYGYGGGF